MMKFLTLSSQMGILLMGLLLISTIKVSQTASLDSQLMTDMSSDDNENDLQEQRRSYDFNRLRHFLLTANAEERAAKREQQELSKRELIHDYLQALSDPNPDRFQEVKKRFKTYCNSYEDLMNSNWAACG